MLVLGILCVAIFFIHSLYSQQEKTVFYIAVAGPMSGENEELGTYMQQGAKLAVDTANANNLLENVELRLLSVDDQSDYSARYRPREEAKALVKQPNLLAVVGHYFNTASMVAGEVYQKHQLPMLLPTATRSNITQDNDWAFSILYNDAYNAAFLANYVAFGLQRKRIAIIHSSSFYGENLDKHFTAALAEHQLSPSYKLQINPKNYRVEKLAEQLEPLQSADIILLAMHYEMAVKIVKFLRNKQVTTDFIGGETLSSFRFIDEAGIYAENTYAVSSFLPNLLGEKARLFELQYEKKFQQTPDWIAAHTYEATQLIIQAIQKEGATRQGIRRFLLQLDNANTAMDSIGGDIYFDKYGMNLRPASIGKVSAGRYISAEYQNIPIKHLVLSHEDDKTSSFNEQIFKRSTVIFTGMYIQRIEKLSVDKGTFQANFNIWFRWNAQEIKDFDFVLFNGLITQKTLVEEHLNSETQEKYKAYSIQADFNQPFQLHDYPFDKQTLKIQVKLKKYSIEDAILVKDFAKNNYLAKTLDLGLWVDFGHLEYVAQKESIYSFRNPKFDKKTYRLNYSIFNYDIQISRKVFEYVIKLMPLLIVMLAAYLTFFLDVETSLPPRLGIGITALLSAVAFHMSQTNSLNNIGYLIKADYFFMLTYWLILLSLTEAVIAKNLLRAGHPKRAHSLDIYASLMYLLIIAVSLLVLLT